MILNFFSHISLNSYPISTRKIPPESHERVLSNDMKSVTIGGKSSVLIHPCLMSLTKLHSICNSHPEALSSQPSVHGGPPLSALLVFEGNIPQAMEKLDYYSYFVNFPPFILLLSTSFHRIDFISSSLSSYSSPCYI